MATFIPIQNTPIQLQDSVTSVNMTSGTLTFYDAGTTDVQDVYSDNTGTVVSASGVMTLDSGGFPASGGNVITLFRDQSKTLKIVGKNAAGAVIFTADGIPAVNSFDATSSTKLDGIEALADVTDADNVGAVIDGKQETPITLPEFYLPVTSPPGAIATVEATSGMPNYRGYPFGAGIDESIDFIWQPPKRWNRGTVTVMINYTTEATDADGVVWGVKAVALSDGEFFAQDYGTSVTVADTLQSGAGMLLNATTPALTIGGSPLDADKILFRIFRTPTNASDTASEDMILLNAKIFWTSDALNDA